MADDFLQHGLNLAFIDDIKLIIALQMSCKYSTRCFHCNDACEGSMTGRHNAGGITAKPHRVCGLWTTPLFLNVWQQGQYACACFPWRMILAFWKLLAKWCAV
jgi:hypothetical protein